MGTYYPFGGNKVRLDKTDMKKVKDMGLPGMKLMGFKDKSYLKIYHNIKHSYFIFPNEKKTTGSSQCSDALIKEMIKSDKIAIVKFIPRENANLRFCALVPQEEKFDTTDGF
jgi:ATP-dependent DNA helicase 2 subunit 1